MSETRDPYSRFVQGWFKTDKGLLRTYPGFKGQALDKPVSQANLPTPQISSKSPQPPMIFTQTFPDPPMPWS